MLLRVYTLLKVLSAASLLVTAIPAPLGHTTPKYASSRIIYSETPPTTRLDEQKPESHSVNKTDSSRSHPVYKPPKLPYHANLDFGDHDDDGPEILPTLKSKLGLSRPKLRKLYGRTMNHAETPQPMRGNHGASLGPQNVPLEEQNLDLLSPPKTDPGKVDNFKWPFSLNHNRLTEGGWAPQQNEKQLPIAKDLAAVNIRLKPGAIREIHWHVTDEWGYVLKGSLRVSVLSPGGNNEGVEYVADVNEGDLWYFPAGGPHSIQAKDTLQEGAEFLLIFDAGTFDENDTFAHVPKDVLAKTFGTYPDMTPFDHIPEHELYIFPSDPPQRDINQDIVVPNPTDSKFFFTYPLSKVAPIEFPGGTIKVADSRSFKVARRIAVAEVSVEVGARSGALLSQSGLSFLAERRELHSLRLGVMLPLMISSLVTLHIFPHRCGHYIENVGDEPLKFLEVLKTDIFQDISLKQWLSLTPHNKAHLGFDLKFTELFPKEKEEIIAPQN